MSNKYIGIKTVYIVMIVIIDYLKGRMYLIRYRKNYDTFIINVLHPYHISK